MGCDIHMFAEQKHKYGWVMVGDVFPNEYLRVRQALIGFNSLTTNQVYRGRNYTLFAFLADVRNNHNIKPLDLPRGLPEDISDELAEEARGWGEDGHSHSWYTLEELEAVDWRHTIIRQAGLIGPSEFELFDKINRPSSWCQGTSNKDYKQVEWFESLSEACARWMEALGELRAFAREENIEPKGLRVVFWFDN